MQKFDHIREAVSRTAFLVEFCIGVRITRSDDGAVLYSSSPVTNGDAISRLAAGVRRVHNMLIQDRSDNNGYSDEKKEPYQVTKVPILVGNQRCALEMIEPRYRAISSAFEVSSAGDRHSADADSVNIKDTLTGVYNRRFIDETLANEMRVTIERGQPLSVIVADIDHFGTINERYGRVAGDLVLQHIALVLQKRAFRTGSWVARYDADSFVFCLPGVKDRVALRAANNLRVAIMSERLPLENEEVSLTCSFGVQTMEKDSAPLSVLMLLHQAQEKLELAKRAGGNAVV